LPAFAFAGLREATDLWDGGLFTLTAIPPPSSILLAVHRTGPARAFWFGSSLFGGSYLTASLIPSFESRRTSTPRR
jgi:hypothetical protein